MTAESLIAELERRKARCLDTEQRMYRERQTLQSALTLARMGEDPGVIEARLRAKGLNLGAKGEA